MRKILVIAVREYRAVVFTWSFVISLLLIPIIGALFVLIVGALTLLVLQEEMGERKFAVVDRTPGGSYAASLEAGARKRMQGSPDVPPFVVVRVEPSANTPDAIQEQRLQLSERVRNKELYGFVEIGPDVGQALAEGKPRLVADPATGPNVRDGGGDLMLGRPSGLLQRMIDAQLLDPSEERTGIRYQAQSLTDDFPNWAHWALTKEVWQRRAAGAQSRELALDAVPFRRLGLSQRDAVTGAVQDGSSAGLHAALMFAALMYVLAGVGGVSALQSTMQEKMERITEMLLGSVGPFQFMMGKLLGLTAITMTLAMIFLYLPCALGRLSGVGSLPVGVLMWFAVFQVLQVLMSGSLYMAVGATAPNQKPGAVVFVPVSLFSFLPFVLLTAVLNDPNGPVATWASFFPMATPTLMVARLAVPPGLPWWQPALGAVLTLATTIACVYVAARIFRVGILLQGKRPGLRDLARWVFLG